MYTVDTALESLKKYDIRESDLLGWEKALDLDIPVDIYGRKQYSPHHINLFKNIKKHIALGRTLDEIRQIIDLPPLVQSRPQPKPTSIRMSQPMSQALQQPVQHSFSQAMPAAQHMQQTERLQYEERSTMAGLQNTVSMASSASYGSASTAYAATPTASVPQTTPQAAMPSEPLNRQQPGSSGTTSAPPKGGMDKSAYASTPQRPTMRPESGNAAASNMGAANVINLVQRLTREKDQLYKKLLETEKLNSHLYSANNLFNKKVRELTQQIVTLRENQNEDDRFKLLDDKARLHKQIIEAERLAQQRQDEMQSQFQEIERLKDCIDKLERKIQALSTAFSAEAFRGDWLESGQLVEVIYDNFGINIEPERVRLFRISELPSRRYGSMAVINTSYQYETNSLWKRDETLTVAYADEDTLEGELTAEYILDGVPVAKALYRVSCRRNHG